MSTRREAKRERILAVGAKLFAAKGYERTSLQEVADRLGVTKPALYYYIENKQELLYEIMSLVMDVMLADIVRIVEGGEPPDRQLEALITSYIGFFTSHPDELKIMILREDSLLPEFRKKVNARQKEYGKYVRSIVSALLKERGGEEVDEIAVTFALLGAMNWIFHWYDPAGPITPQRLSEDFLRIFTPGILGGARH